MKAVFVVALLVLTQASCFYCSKCKLDPKCCVVPQACEGQEQPDGNSAGVAK